MVPLTLLSPGETVPHNCTVTGNTGQHNDCHTWTWGMSSCQVGSIKHAHINTWCLIYLILTRATCHDVLSSLVQHVMMSHPHQFATCYDILSSLALVVQHVVMRIIASPSLLMHKSSLDNDQEMVISQSSAQQLPGEKLKLITESPTDHGDHRSGKLIERRLSPAPISRASC